MAKFATGALLAGVASLALASAASAAGTLTPAEAKCQLAANKAGAKFVGSKAKCAIKCIGGARKGDNPFSDCFAPYGGATLACIDDMTILDKKGAEDKFRDSIRKGCDPTFKTGTDCPECYSGGDCSTSGEAGDRVQNIEGQVDSFGPGVFCEQPGADDLETKCELNTAKALSKLVSSVDKCYDKCFQNARKVPPKEPIGDCTPPGAGPTAACIAAADAKAIAGVNKKCGDVGAIPDCAATDDYPNGASWTNLVEVAISGNIPGTYCESPSGAFLE